MVTRRYTPHMQWNVGKTKSQENVTEKSQVWVGRKVRGKSHIVLSMSFAALVRHKINLTRKSGIQVFFFFTDSCRLDIAIFITKTCPCNVYPLKPHFYIVKLGYAGLYLFYLILLQNIDCGYSLELPRRGGSNVYPQSMF